MYAGLDGGMEDGGMGMEANGQCVGVTERIKCLLPPLWTVRVSCEMRPGTRLLARKIDVAARPLSDIIEKLHTWLKSSSTARSYFVPRMYLLPIR